MLRTWKASGLLLLIFGVAILSLSSVSVRSSSADDPTGTLADIIAAGKITVGSDIAYPPFEDYNLNTGAAEGFDVDIMDYLAEFLGEEYDTTIVAEFVASDWDPIIPNLQAEQFDVICSAMTITAAREAEVDFTRFYYQSAMGALVATGNPENLKAPADLNDTNILIGVQAGTTTDIWAEANLPGYETQISTYDDFPFAVAALKAGTVDVVLGDIAVLSLDAAASAETEVAFSWMGAQPENFGIACRTDDDDLREALNKGIDELLGSDENNPTPSKKYNEIYKKWHGTDVAGYEEDEDTPAFEFIVALAVLFSSSLVIRRRRRN
ncbi:MAG: substrate-binding periplasmic protein [Candidatus Hodarchaeota archaeon]